jgi:hypothetical protein
MRPSSNISVNEHHMCFVGSCLHNNVLSAATPKEVGDLRRNAGSAYVNHQVLQLVLQLLSLTYSSLIFHCHMVHPSLF